MDSDESIVLSRETFLGELGLVRLKENLPDAHTIDRLYELTSEYLVSKGLGVVATFDSARPSELPFKLPGLPIHVRLSTPSREELSAFITAGSIVLGMTKGSLETVAIGVIAALMTRMKVLRPQYGELCLVEAIKESERATAKITSGVLYGHKCRRPKAECRFHDTTRNSCLFSLQKVRLTMRSLEEKKIVRRNNAVEPAEFDIVV